MSEIRRSNLNLINSRFEKQVDFANALGMSPAYVNHLLTGFRNIGEKKAREIEKKLNLSHLELDADYIEGQVIRPEFPKPESNVAYIDKQLPKVPLISYVSAGHWCAAIDNYQINDAEKWLDCPAPHGEHTFALRVDGDSMTSQHQGDTFPSGTLVFIDPEKPYFSGSYVVAKILHKDEVTFKKYVVDGGKQWLMPLNPQYEKIELVEGMHICGVLCFAGREY